MGKTIREISVKRREVNMGVKLLSTLLAVIIFGTVDCRDIELELEEMEGVGRTTDLWEPRRRNLDIFKTSQGKKCK